MSQPGRGGAGFEACRMKRRGLRVVVSLCAVLLFPGTAHAQQGTPELAIQSGHTEQILSIDFSPDGSVTVLELQDFVTRRVIELTEGRQHPFIPKQLDFTDFPLTAGE